MNPQRFLDNCSLEITAADVSGLGAARAAGIAPGSAISITFLPRNDVDELATIAGAVRRLGFTPVPHISARRIKSKGELTRFLAKLRDLAMVNRVFVVAGDPRSPLGPYGDALAIIRTGVLSEFGIGHVGISGYPEGHPRIAQKALSRAMNDKLAAISNAGQTAEIVTQFVFDPDVVLTWLNFVRGEGVGTPIRIGLPGPASVQSLLRFAARCGVSASGSVLAKYGVSVGNLLSTATPDRLVKILTDRIDPAVHGTVRAHVYPFGSVANAVKWVASCSDLAHPR